MTVLILSLSFSSVKKEPLRTQSQNAPSRKFAKRSAETACEAKTQPGHVPGRTKRRSQECPFFVDRMDLDREIPGCQPGRMASRVE